MQQAHEKKEEGHEPLEAELGTEASKPGKSSGTHQKSKTANLSAKRTQGGPADSLAADADDERGATKTSTPHARMPRPRMMKPDRLKLAALALTLLAGVGIGLRRRLAAEYPLPPSDGAVLVTGTSSGIGFDVCVKLAAETSFVPFCGVRKDEDAERLLNATNGRAHPVILDVTQQEQIDAAIAAVRDSGLALAGLINCAGVMARGMFETTDLGAHRTMMDVNYFGVVALTQAALPLLRESRGRLITIGSLLGLISVGPGISAYSASKFALEPLHDALRAELLPYAVSVSVVEPGTVATRVMSSAKERGHFQDKADAANARGSELSATYSWFYDSPEAEGGAAFSEKFAQPPPIVTRAVMHALTAARPQTRYAVGNVMGVPAWLAVAVVRVLPDRLRDRLAMAPFNTNWFNATHPAATH